MHCWLMEVPKSCILRLALLENNWKSASVDEQVSAKMINGGERRFKYLGSLSLMWARQMLKDSAKSLGEAPLPIGTTK